MRTRQQAAVSAFYSTIGALVAIFCALLVFGLLQVIYTFVAGDPPHWLGLVVGIAVIFTYSYKEARKPRRRRQIDG